MAKMSWINRNNRKRATVKKYAALRAELKAKKDYHAIVGKLSGYVEFFSNVSTESDPDWIATLDFGVTYEVHRNLQLDAGINIGLTDAADDLNPFVGLSIRY